MDLVSVLSIFGTIATLIGILISTLVFEIYVVTAVLIVLFFIAILAVVYTLQREIKAQFSTWKEALEEFNNREKFGQNVRLVVRLVDRDEELAELRSMVDDPQIRAVVISGPPDIGKTRLIFEATERRQKQTIKSTDPHELSRASLLLCNVTIKGFFARIFRQRRFKNEDILVIIEDPSRERVEYFTRRSLELNNLKILITIPTSEHVPMLNYGKDERIKVMQLGPLSEQHAYELLEAAGAKFSHDTKRWVVENASGNPGVLRFAARFGLEPENGGGDFADRITNEFKARVRGVLSDDALKKLELLSVLTEVGVKNVAHQEIKLICALFGDNIDPDSIVSELDHFKSAGVVRYNGARIEVQPHIFGDGLAKSVLSNRSTQLSELFNELNPNGKLRLVSRLQDLKSCDDVELFWDGLFKPITSVQVLQSKLKDDHLLHLVASAVPERVMPLINERLKETTVEERKEIAWDEKEALVVMLEELLSHEETSKEALRRLAKLAEAEKESDANSVTRVFCDYFSPYHPYARLSLDERLTELKTFALSTECSSALHSIGVKAIERAIDHRPLLIHSRREMTRLGSLSDETKGSVLNYIEGATNLLMKVAEIEESSVANDALVVLPQANVDCTIWTLRLTSTIAPFKTLIARLKTLVKWGKAGKPIFVSHLDGALRHIHDMLSEEIKKMDETPGTEYTVAAGLRKCGEQVKQLIDALNADFSVRVKKLADSGWAADETGPQNLARDIIADPTRLTDDLIEWLCSEEVGWGSFAFFRELGKLDSAHQFTKRIEQVGTQKKGIDAFANYFEGLSQIDKEFVTKLLNEFTERQSVTADAIVAATGRIGYDPVGYQRIERLLKENKVNPLLAKRAIHSHKWIDQLSVDQCSRLMKLVVGPNLQNAVEVIDYLVFWSSKRSITGELADLAWRCLEAMPSIKTDQSHQSYNFDELAALLAQADITRAYTLLENLLKQPDKRQSWDPLSIWGRHQFWNVLWGYDRERTLRFVLEIVLGSPALSYRIIQDLRDIIDQDRNAEVLIKVALESEKKAELISQCLTGCIKTTSKFWSIALRIIDQYPKNERIKSLLTINVTPSGGWVEEMLRDLKNCLKEVENLRGDAKTPESAQQWLKDVDSYIRGKISRWKSFDD